MSRPSTYKSPIDTVCEKRHVEFYTLCDRISKNTNMTREEAIILRDLLQEKTRDLVTVLATIREHIRAQQARSNDDAILRKFQLQLPKPNTSSASATASIIQKLVDRIDETADDTSDIDDSFMQLAEVLGFSAK
jgi:hypothetical protein